MEANRLTKEQVLHVAALAKLELKEEEVLTYLDELKSIVEEINKINKVEVNTEEILISPSTNKNNFQDDVVEEKNEAKRIREAFNKIEDDYVQVVGVFNE